MNSADKINPSSQKDATGLAETMLHAVATQPLFELLPPALLAGLLQQAALASLRQKGGGALLQALLLEAQKVLGRPAKGTPNSTESWNEASGQGPIGERLRDILPPEVVSLLRELLSRPYTPDRTLVVAVLSREPFRRLNRELMMGTLLDYSRRVRSSMAEGGTGKSFGALGRLASEAVKKSTSALGAIAPGVTSAVSDEFDRQMQRRAAEFADGAVDEMVQRLAKTLTDPTRAAEQVELKLAMLDALLALRGPQLAQEISRMQLPVCAEKLQAAALAWLEREDASAKLTQGLALLLTALDSALPRREFMTSGLRAALLALLTHLLRPLATSADNAR